MLKEYTFSAVTCINVSVEAENLEEAIEEAYSHLQMLSEDHELRFTPNDFELDLIEEESKN